MERYKVFAEQLEKALLAQKDSRRQQCDLEFAVEHVDLKRASCLGTPINLNFVKSTALAAIRSSRPATPDERNVLYEWDLESVKSFKVCSPSLNWRLFIQREKLEHAR